MNHYQKQILDAAMRANKLASQLLDISGERREGEADDTVGCQELQAAKSESSTGG